MVPYGHCPSRLRRAWRRATQTPHRLPSGATLRLAPLTRRTDRQPGPRARAKPRRHPARAPFGGGPGSAPARRRRTCHPMLSLRSGFRDPRAKFTVFDLEAPWRRPSNPPARSCHRTDSIAHPPYTAALFAASTSCGKARPPTPRGGKGPRHEPEARAADRARRPHRRVRQPRRDHHRSGRAERVRIRYLHHQGLHHRRRPELPRGHGRRRRIRDHQGSLHALQREAQRRRHLDSHLFGRQRVERIREPAARHKTRSRSSRRPRSDPDAARSPAQPPSGRLPRREPSSAARARHRRRRFRRASPYPASPAAATMTIATRTLAPRPGTCAGPTNPHLGTPRGPDATLEGATPGHHSKRTLAQSPAYLGDKF